MKQFKKSIMLFAVALFCMVPFFASSITAHAATTTTYYVKYVESLGEWRYQAGTWNDNNAHSSVTALSVYIKDGDSLAIDGNAGISITVDVKLSNLTIVNSTMAIVHTKGVDNVYVINGSSAAINGDVTYAEVYDGAVCNFNNNVGTLKILSSDNNLKATVAVVGTTNYLYAGGKDYKHYEFYNFAAGKLFVENGSLKTKSEFYSTTPQATTTTPSTSTSTGSNASSGEYDDVPKTGDIRFNPLWLVMIAGVCLAGAYRLKKN